MVIEDVLFVIPARGGSKGLPRKNIKLLAGKPLICYTIDAARKVTTDDNICVSTDDDEIIRVVENYGLKVPFVRPSKLAMDTSGSREVILHSIDYFQKKFDNRYSRVCLLQPTSPFRTGHHIEEAFNLWSNGLDMVVSVNESKSNPYFNLFEEDERGYLKKSKEGVVTRRQDAPSVWEFNGAIYIIQIDSLMFSPIAFMSKIKKYTMNDRSSIDIDTKMDWEIANLFIKKL
jgi:CMP-N,N'-diacetyllegionaminic acid synthase